MTQLEVEHPAATRYLPDSKIQARHLEWSRSQTPADRRSSRARASSQAIVWDLIESRERPIAHHATEFPRKHMIGSMDQAQPLFAVKEANIGRYNIVSLLRGDAPA